MSQLLLPPIVVFLFLQVVSATPEDRTERIYHVSRAVAHLPNPPKTTPADPATFEEAITATGFGTFNYLIMLLGALPVNWSFMIVISNISQIIPSLKCHFQLNLSQIGMLNASPFIGNIMSPFLWGYVADTMGRRKLMIYTALADGLCNILIAFSVNIEMVITFKFLSGFVIMAPASLIFSYLSECHSNKNRSRMILITGIFSGTTHLIMPLLAWAMLPKNFYYIHSWQVYLLVLSIPSLLAGLSFIAFPESPKFLMMIGKHDEALAVFKKIYALNTGQPAESYPITKLLCENKQTQNVTQERKKISQAIRNGWKQFKPLFFQPYLYRIILCTSIQFFLMQGANTLRIWMPEIFTQMDKYTSVNNNTNVGMCQAIVDSINKTYEEDFSNATTIVNKSCNAEQSSDDVYIKLCIIGSISILMFIIVIIATSIINKKIVLGFLLFISGISGIALIWCSDPTVILLISALFTTQTGVAIVTFMSIVVDLFPTSFRTLTVLIASTSGRVACVVANIVFPKLLVAGCVPPFVYLGANLLVCIIPLILLPSKVEEL